MVWLYVQDWKQISLLSLVDKSRREERREGGKESSLERVE